MPLSKGVRLVDNLCGSWTRSLRAKLQPTSPRTKLYNGRDDTFSFNFKLSLRYIRNPNMAANGRFPTALGDFKYEITN